MGIDLIASRRRIITNSPHLAIATPANPVSFSATLAAPLKELACAFSPVQAGSGDPAPDNVRPISGWTGCNVVRCGKNLFDTTYEGGTVNGTTITTLADGRVQTSGTPSSSFNEVIGTAHLSAGTYTLSGCPSGGGSAYKLQITDYPVVNNLGQDFGNGVSFTLAEEMDVAVRIQLYTSAPSSLTFSPMICLSSATNPTSYAPYTGQTLAVQFPATKNLLDPAKVNSKSNYKNRESGYFYTDPITLEPNTNYIISPTSTSALGVSDYWVLYVNPSENPDYLVITNPSVKYVVSAGTPQAVGFKTGPTGVIRFGVIVGVGNEPKESAINAFMSINWQIEKGSTATPYEPYGTIYGGYVDPVRGVAMAEWTMKRMSELSWSYTSSYSRFESGYMYSAARAVADVQTVFCSCYKAVPNKGGTQYNDLEIGFNANNQSNPYLIVKDSNYSTKDAFVASLSDDDVVVYKLATPIEYPLTPAQLKTLKGANVIYTSLNGNVSPIYWTN